MIDIDADQLIALATRTNQSFYFGSFAEIVAAHPPAAAAMAEGPRYEGLVILPLRDEGDVFACLAFSFEQPPLLDRSSA